jgi:predicted oxidoreductase
MLGSQPFPLQTHFPTASRMVYGCMGLGGGWNDNALTKNDIHQAQALIEQCLANGVNVFDHADIYTFGKAEQAFGNALKHNYTLREQMLIQTKCGIRFADETGVKRYDFSPEYITACVEQSLQQLHIEQIDVFILHRPDVLADLSAVARTIETLQQVGKIKHLGVSNMSVPQLQHLQQYVSTPIVVNQIEMSLAHHPMLDAAIATNIATEAVQNGFAGLLEYAAMHNIQLQAWGSLAQGRFQQASQSPTDNAVSDLVTELAHAYNTTKAAIILAFLTRLPQGIQPVIGTTNPQRMQDCFAVHNVHLSHADWYALLTAVRGSEVP